MTDNNWRPGPHVPRSHSYQIAFCSDPNCGMHLVAFDKDHNPICEVVQTPHQTLVMTEVCKEFLYEKATERRE